MTEKTVETLSDELSQVLQEIVTNPHEEPKRAVVVDEKTILVDEVHYQIIEDYRNGFNIEAFNERYNDIFERYDYIVGDWGHEKLRLKGFFKHSHKLATPDRDIDYLQEYILEYCNFGCQYFVLERDPGAKHKPVLEEEKPQRPRRERNSQRKRQNNPKREHVFSPVDLDSPARNQQNRKFKEKSQNRQKRHNNETNPRNKKEQDFNLKEFIPKETMKEYGEKTFKPKTKKSNSQHFSMKEVEKSSSSKVKKSIVKNPQKKGFHIRENQQRGK